MKTARATQITIRPGYPDDLEALQQLFVGTISQICTSGYNAEQIRAWLLGVENKQRWVSLFSNQYGLVDKEKIAGLCTFEKGCYIDSFYVHNNYQRRGIAKKRYGLLKRKQDGLGKWR